KQRVIMVSALSISTAACSEQSSLSLHDALPISYAEAMARGEAGPDRCPPGGDAGARALARLLRVPAVPYDRARGEHQPPQVALRSEEHTSELQSREKLVCRLLLEKKKKI